MRRLSPSLLLALLMVFAAACSSWWPTPAPAPAFVCGRLQVDRYSVPVRIELGRPQTWDLSGSDRVTLTVRPCASPEGVVAGQGGRKS